MKGADSIRVDLASDTLTRPTAAMREAMAQAEVGDDVFDEDPTVQALEARIAELLDKQDAIYVPSGSMGNQIAVRLHCQPGDELLCEASCHLHNIEQAAHVQLRGVASQPIAGREGILQVEQLAAHVRPENDHMVRTRLVCLENTHNRAAGRILPLENAQNICQWASEQGLASHLDGARLFNAQVATGTPAADWARLFDTVSVCFSKGLGAPVGSALCGTAELIRQARRHRKLLGGGMRQAGIIAAGALYALDHHVDRLAEDHATAQQLAEAIRQLDGLTLQPDTIDTNMLIFRVDERLGDAASFCDRLRDQGVRMLPISAQQVRAVTHMDVSPEQVNEACQVLGRLVE